MKTQSSEDFYQSFEKVSSYALSKHGFETVLCSDTHAGVCDFLRREIVINSSLGIEKKLYILIHEIGHILIRKNWKKFEKEFSAHAGKYYDGRVTRSKKFRVSTVEEEFEAWKRGLRLAKKLGATVDESKFNNFKCECLMSYINWASQ